MNSLTSDIHYGNNPRYGRRGRIPNSLNIPFNELVDSENGKFINIKELSKLFSDNFGALLLLLFYLVYLIALVGQTTPSPTG